jgi:hypothetical protein
MKDNPGLVEEYRSAWEKYDLSLRELQADPDKEQRGRLESLLLSVETARLQYSTARDRLAAEMLGTDLSSITPATADHRIRDTAKLIWELSGKPHGTAENDWLRAEHIVRYGGILAS